MTLRYIDVLKWRLQLMSQAKPRPSIMDCRPPRNPGLTSLDDKSVFARSFPVLAARIPPSKTGHVLKSPAMAKSILKLPRLRTVRFDPLEPDGDRLVLLDAPEESDLLPEARDFLKPISTGLVNYDLVLDFDYWTAEQILHSILPQNIQPPTGFSQIGHIAHFNLQKEYHPYKYIIGQVILDKFKSLKTVVNKSQDIQNQFRVLDLELLAGEPNYIVVHHESECRFTLDFSQVYFNPRLGTEHARLFSSFQPTDVIADVFAGVGPFAVPAAKRGCAVWANDLNPASYEYLKKNVADNWVGEFVDVSCSDGRSFIKEVVAWSMLDPFKEFTRPPLSKTGQIKARRRKDQSRVELDVDTSTGGFRRRIDHFIMNLPQQAIEFLDAFRGLFRLQGDSLGSMGEVESIYDRMPRIHCYCFTKVLEEEAAMNEIMERVEEVLRRKLDIREDEVQLQFVRSVAPTKTMWCISFRLPRDVGFAES